MKLINDLIIEQNGILSVVRSGTLIRETVEDFFSQYVSEIPKNAKIIKNTVEDFTDKVEGRQTDVDDFDMHHVDVAEGEFIFQSSVPLTDEIIRDFQEEIEEPVTAEKMANYIQEDLDENDLYEILVSKLLPGLEGYTREDDDRAAVVDYGLNGYNLNLTIKMNINRYDMADEPFHKGSYRTGGYYPDA